MMHTLASLLACSLLASADAPKDRRFIDQGTADKRLAGYLTPEGLDLAIALDDAFLNNPVALAFGDDGTPYVMEHRTVPTDGWREETRAVKYKDGTTREYRTWVKKSKDVIKALVASKPGGPWDGSRVVLEVEQGAAMLFHDGWLYVSGGGAVRRYKPSKPGGAFDVSQLVSHGFRASDKAQASGLAIGPDGWLYISVGADDHHAEGSDGSRATVYRTGAIFRCRPDGTKLHTFATGFRSASGQLGFTPAGHVFAADGPRLLQVSEGSDFGYRLALGSPTAADPVRSTLTGEIAGKLPPMLTTKDASYSGVVVYNDTQLPEAFRGLLYAADTGNRVVRAVKVEQSGATFGVAESFNLLRAPKDAAFQPRQVVVGPDGALYILDGRGTSGKGGRVYRIQGSKSEMLKLNRLAKINEESDENLLKSLCLEDATVRGKAQAEFIRRGDKNRKALLGLLLQEKEDLLLGKLSAVGALQTMFDADVQKAFLRVLGNGDDELRRVVADALGLVAKRADADVHDGLLKALTAEDNDLRRSVAIALAKIAGPGAGGILATTLAGDEGKDRVLVDGLVRSLEMLGKSGIDALLSVADSGVQKDIDRVAATFLGLRTRPAFDALPPLLKNPHLSTKQRVELLESILNYRVESLEAVVTPIAANAKESDEVRQAMLKILVSSGATSGPKTSAFVVAQLGNNDLDVRMAALVTASALRVTASSGVLVKALAGELSPAERLATVRTLRQAGVKEKEVWEAVRREMGNESVSLEREALRTLSVLHPETALVEAEAHLLAKDVDLQREAVVVSGLSATGARRVGKLWQDGKLPKALRPAVLTTLRAWAEKDAECAKLLEAISQKSKN